MDQSIPKPIMVTGLSGMVGSRFRELYEDRFDFENLDISVGVDITDQAQVKQVVKNSAADVLIHLAAFTNVSEAYKQQGDTQGACYRVNVLGTENIAAACREFGKYLIHISTDFIFDGTKTSPYLETDTPHPIEWYGTTKYMAEELVQKLIPEALILRLSYPYQAKPSRPDFLQNLVAKLTADTLPPAFTDHTITPTFVDDIAETFAYCITNRPKGIYHLVGSSAQTDFEIAQMVKSAFALPGQVKPGSLKEYLKTVNRPYQQTMRVSNQKLRSEFKLNPKTFPEGLVAIKEQMV